MKCSIITTISLVGLGLLMILNRLSATTQTQTVEYTTTYTERLHLKHIDVKIFNDQGQLKQHLNAPSATYQLADKLIYIDQPAVHIHQPDQKDWYINAQQATVTEDKTVIFQSQVRLRQPHSYEQQATIIETEYLVYQLNQEYIHTDYPIKLIQDNKSIESLGLHADLTNNHIKLLAQAKAYYQHA